MPTEQHPMRLTPIPAEKVDSVWPWAEPLIRAACEQSGGLETVEDIHDKVRRGQGYVLVNVDDETAIVFERSDHCLHVVSMGGRNIVGRVGQLVDACWLVAGYVGCKGISYKGRKGWNRLLARYGFRE